MLTLYWNNHLLLLYSLIQYFEETTLDFVQTTNIILEYYTPSGRQLEAL
jgi:hypothetical protein